MLGGRGGRRLRGSLLGLSLVAHLSLDLSVLGHLVVCLVSHLYPFPSSSCQLLWPRLTSPTRSRATVRARARSRRARPTPAVSSSSPVALAKRFPNRSLRSVDICSASSSSGMS